MRSSHAKQVALWLLWLAVVISALGWISVLAARGQTQGDGALALIQPAIFASVHGPPKLPRARVVMPPPLNRTFYFSATATAPDGLASDFSNEISVSTTNPTRPITLAWDASPGWTNGPLIYTVWQGGASRAYTNARSAGTNLTLTFRPLLPLTNLVVSVTTSNATSLAWAPRTGGPWTSVGATNWIATNPPTTRLWKALGTKSKPPYIWIKAQRQ